jgi:hypothetical protein
MVVMHDTGAETVVFTVVLQVGTNYSINKHGDGNKTTAISLITLSDLSALGEKVGSFQWHLCNNRDLLAAPSGVAGINEA